MTNLAFNVNVELTAINCGRCGGTYAINERYRKNKYKEGAGWRCPYCMCSWGYFGDLSEAARLKKELEKEKREREFYQRNASSEREARERTERRLVATKGAKTRLRNRIKNGVCPCCTRSFSNLRQHMAAQHPEFTPEEKESEEMMMNVDSTSDQRTVNNVMRHAYRVLSDEERGQMQALKDKETT